MSIYHRYRYFLFPLQQTGDDHDLSEAEVGSSMSTQTELSAVSVATQTIEHGLPRDIACQAPEESETSVSVQELLPSAVSTGDETHCDQVHIISISTIFKDVRHNDEYVWNSVATVMNKQTFFCTSKYRTT